MTPLDKVLKRSIRIKDEEFVITLTPLALKLTRKGHQHGMEFQWESLISGEQALAVALQASLGQLEPAVKPRASAAAPRPKTKRRR